MIASDFRPSQRPGHKLRLVSAQSTAARTNAAPSGSRRHTNSVISPRPAPAPTVNARHAASRHTPRSPTRGGPGRSDARPSGARPPRFGVLDLTSSHTRATTYGRRAGTQSLYLPVLFDRELSTRSRLRPSSSTDGRTGLPNALNRCAPGRNRTCDLEIRRLLLYPLSYGGQTPCATEAITTRDTSSLGGRRQRSRAWTHELSASTERTRSRMSSTTSSAWFSGSQWPASSTTKR